MWKLHWRSSWVIERLLEFKQGEVGMLLFRLHSVLHIPDEEDDQIAIPHASFTEFLLDTRRSLHYHVRRHSLAEYSDLVARLLLRSLSVTKFLYPIHQTSIDTALTSWRDHVCSTFRAQSTEDKLRAFASTRWAVYCWQSDSPSPDLIAALEDFDPYSYFAMVFNHCLLSWSEARVSDWEPDHWHKNSQPFSTIAYDLDRKVEQFRTAVSFVKTIRPKVPWNFVRRSESFLRRCTIGFNTVDLKPETLACWLYFMLLLRLCFVPSHYHRKKSILWMLLRPLGRDQMWATLLKRPVPLIAPADSKLVPPLTSSWVIIQASQESSIAWFERFLFLDYPLLQQELVEVFENAAWNAGCNLVKLWQLHHLKRSITKDRKLLEAKLRGDTSIEDGLEYVLVNASLPGEGIESAPSTGVQLAAGSHHFAQDQVPMLPRSSDSVASERITSHQATKRPQSSQRRDTRHTSGSIRRRAIVFEPDDDFLEWRSDAH
uniref:Uncharacterized protein n=1 Tax=Moniliophthora roreri TaxID=221103 RepID=A0A0W0G6D7_MONRR